MRHLLSGGVLPFEGDKMKIGVTGKIGYGKALELFNDNEEFLMARFPGYYIRQFLVAKDEPCDYIMKNIIYVHDSDGGIYRALWELCEELGCGCEVRLRDIPVMQEVIEIMECFDEDPYESRGLNVTVAAADELPEGFTVIGETNDTKDRVIVDGDARRFLTPPSRQDKDIADRKTKRR